MRKKEKLPPTVEQLIANDPLWEKIFKLRLNNQNDEAELIKQEILGKYK